MIKITINLDTEILLKELCDLFEIQTGKPGEYTPMVTAMIENAWEDKFHA